MAGVLYGVTRGQQAGRRGREQSGQGEGTCLVPTLVRGQEELLWGAGWGRGGAGRPGLAPSRLAAPRRLTRFGGTVSLGQ